MDSHCTRVRRLAFIAAALVLAAALPGTAQGQACAASLPSSGTGSCTLAGYTARFSSATGSIELSTQTITLNSGWVWLTPNGGGSYGTTPVKVTTTYVTGGVSSVRTPVDPETGRVTDGGRSAPSFLVVAYATYTAVAVVSGTMQTPAISAGCEVRYTSSGPGTPFPISNDPGVVTILSGLGVTYPSTCS